MTTMKEYFQVREVFILFKLNTNTIHKILLAMILSVLFAENVALLQE